ncbi:hypothetical protein SUGI_1073730 [Cryptomeria japonica]|nr:hypothetical protein SUGI_1073730 [Cryptomeria japonica]
MRLPISPLLKKEPLEMLTTSAVGGLTEVVGREDGKPSERSAQSALEVGRKKKRETRGGKSCYRVWGVNQEDEE